jgi:uncharacterized OB-fold protein
VKESPSPPRRIAPLLTPENRFFWTAGAEGELRFKRCRACRTWIHPPAPHCPACLSKDLAIEAVSGRARVGAYTVNRQTWHPAYPPPYVIAIVEIEEAPYVRLTTNVVHCAPESVHVGMPVQVRFEPVEDVWLPLFEPVGG